MRRSVPLWMCRMWAPFYKTRRKETTQIDRAERAQIVCESGHGPARQMFHREFKEEL